MTPLFELLFESLDERLRLRKPSRKVVHKVFPHHWSFLVSEVAVFSFVVLVLTGIFLTMFYQPVAEPVVYQGSAALFDGRELPAAYASIVELSHDVPGGLLFRRIHRGAAYAFFIAGVVHLLRILLTGAFRRPREPNYHIGLTLLVFVILAAYTGQNLVYDLLSGASLRIAYALLQTIPLIGDNLVVAVFGGPFPGEVVSRFYIVHILILPALIAATMTAHLLLLVRQKHTNFPRRGVNGERLVSGRTLWPDQFAASTVLLLALSGALAAFATVVPWSDFDLHGPLRPGQASNASHAELWEFWIQGAITTLPGIEFSFGGVTITQMFLAGTVLPSLIFAALYAYPFIERHVIPHEHVGHHHVLQRPFDVPFRAAAVFAGTAFVCTLIASNANDVLARAFGIPVEAIMWAFRIALIAVPVLAGGVAYWRGRRRAATRSRSTSTPQPDAGESHVVDSDAREDEGAPRPQAGSASGRSGRQEGA